MSSNRENAKRIYQANSEPTEAIVFVNWMKARNLRGFINMYRLSWSVNQMMQRARKNGLFDARVAIVGPREVLVVSYWENEEALRASFRDKAHVEMMRYTYQYPDDLVLGNETYSRPFSTRYLNEAGGFALAKSIHTPQEIPA
ncbi:MAG: DUF4188 domain-containing protein [Anaerolineae bacterium]|nr:DUF4188 domain-containing protein [Anaerolineae bacterium]